MKSYSHIEYHELRIVFLRSTDAELIKQKKRESFSSIGTKRERRKCELMNSLIHSLFICL